MTDTTMLARLRKAAEDCEWHSANGYQYDEILMDGSHSNPSAEQERQFGILFREAGELATAHQKMRLTAGKTLATMQLLGWDEPTFQDGLITEEDRVLAVMVKEAYDELSESIGVVACFGARFYRDSLVDRINRRTLADAEERQSGEKAMRRHGTSSPVRDSQPTEGEAGPRPPKSRFIAETEDEANEAADNGRNTGGKSYR